MKEICFQLSADQKRYSFLFKNLKDRYNVGRDEYPSIITSALGKLIRAEGVIRENQQSTHENRDSMGGITKNNAWGTHLYSNRREELEKIKYWSL